MNLKKIFMIILLIIFVVGIGFILVNANNTAEEKTSNVTTDTNTVASDVTEQNASKSQGGIVRKTTQKVEPDMNNILEIKDDFFIEQTNDMYYNLEDYLGKTIKIEGFVTNYKDNNGDICYGVVRNTPGCCGADGLAGVDIRYDGEYPEIDTWVEVVGVMGKDNTYDSDIPAIQVTSIREKEEGTTFVTN